jgi:hypothetical protein
MNETPVVAQHGEVADSHSFDAAVVENAAALGWLIAAESFDAND